MGVPGWSRTPAQNGAIATAIAALDGASARSFPGTTREVMAAVRRLADDLSGVLVTSGTLNAYVVQTGSGLTELRRGLRLMIQVDRDNTAVATLNVDGLGPLPWVDAGGVPLQPGRLIKGRYYDTILDTLADGSTVAWRVQAGASTLDEIPGLIDLRQDVVEAAEVTLDKTAAAIAAATSAQARSDEATLAAATATTKAADAAAQAATSVAQAGTAVAAAAIATTKAGDATARANSAAASATQAQNAVAIGRVTRDTLVDVDGVVGSGLGSSLNFPDGAVGEVMFGPDAGYYAKTGASGAGAWVLKTKATVPGLDERTKDVLLTKSITDDITRYMQGILGRFNGLQGFVWAAARDSLGRVPLGVTKTGAVAIRRNLVRGLALSDYVEVWGDRAGRIALGISKRGAVTIRRNFVRGLSMTNYIEVWGDRAGRVALGITKRGAIAFSRTNLLVSSLLWERYGLRHLWTVVDKNGRVGLAINYRGRLQARIDPPSWVASQREATLPETTVIALGAAGTVQDVVKDKEFYRYKSTPDGVTMPYVMRPAYAGSPSLLDTTSRLAIHISYGQSWRTETLTDDIPAAVADIGEPRMAMSLGRMGGSSQKIEPIQTIGTAFQTSAIIDLAGLSMSRGANIGYAAAQALARFRRRDNARQMPVLEYCHGYPGYTWEQLKPGTDPWAQGILMHAAARIQAARYGKTPFFEATSFTHGGAVDGGGEDYFQSLTEMVAGYDALALNGAGGTPLHFFTDQTAASIGQGQAQLSYLDQVRFAVTNAARVHLIGPRYPYPFRDNIHHTGLGYTRIGELEGLVKRKVLDLGEAWDCARISAIAVENGGFTLAVTRPPGFGDLAVDTAMIEAAPDKGFVLKVNGVIVPIASVTVSANLVRIIPVAMPASGATVEVSYAFYGRLDIPPGTHAGAWGNIKRVGPPSSYFAGETVDTWLCAYKSTLVV
ncbi:hypothetical protein ASG40_13040 [Methylobacterium sp. Leaf399]|uniref:hypothetical protein n=1 Tax=unclassified Methylobacterium TaxID=2615210 RepID=UPI0006FA3E0F|nr:MULTISPECIES: hypothetical protein [unclassified Methylobacterium]KQP50846.1 hypothetical protein ASF39_11420 [Methylobacterium sp. Leaf108]KQT07827.1 hypothetical protein ASG40_13040 [Methylobacterium sp. Leaf399]KQT88942.1 hypothetical protein ASG59_13810 [Methylobacterium sp. Leaf466]